MLCDNTPGANSRRITSEFIQSLANKISSPDVKEMEMKKTAWRVDVDSPFRKRFRFQEHNKQKKTVHFNTPTFSFRCVNPHSFRHKFMLITSVQVFDIGHSIYIFFAYKCAHVTTINYRKLRP